MLMWRAVAVVVAAALLVVAERGPLRLTRGRLRLPLEQPAFAGDVGHPPVFVPAPAGENSQPPVCLGKPATSRPVSAVVGVQLAEARARLATWLSGSSGSIFAMLLADSSWASSVTVGQAGSGRPVEASEAPIRWL